MATAILVMGATGTVGGAALDALHAGAEPMALVRDAERAAQALDRRTPFRVADLANEGSVRAALKGVDAVLLCSAHGPAMRAQQIGAVRAIGASDVNRVVTISGSPVSVSADSSAGSGRDHFAIEKARGTLHLVLSGRPEGHLQDHPNARRSYGAMADPGSPMRRSSRLSRTRSPTSRDPWSQSTSPGSSEATNPMIAARD
jgi:uncharacterized protein YbjT (DUF2867 family)